MAELQSTLILNADMQPLSMLPPSTRGWQSVVSGVFKNIYSVVHEYDDWKLHSPSMTIRVPSIVMLKRYSKRKHVAAWKRANLWLRDQYTCQYCAQEFPATELTRDHVVPQCYGGATNWENIVAACHPCNNRRGHNIKIQPIRKPYKPSYYELVERRKNYPIYLPHESWQFYLMWPEDKVIIRNK